MGNVWIRPWANFAQYMDRTFPYYIRHFPVCGSIHPINKSTQFYAIYWDDGKSFKLRMKMLGITPWALISLIILFLVALLLIIAGHLVRKWNNKKVISQEILHATWKKDFHIYTA